MDTKEHKIKFVCPLITVTDMKVSRNFYENLLGQTVVTDFGENVSFGGFAIHLRPHFKMLIDNKEVIVGGNSFELYFEYDNVEQICEKLKAENVEFIHELREQPWKQFVVRFYDPDKNIIEIGESMEHLIFRLYQQNNSVDEISVMTGMDKTFIEKAIFMNNKPGDMLEWCDNYKLEEMSVFFNNRAPIYEEKHLEHIGGMESKQILASFFPPHTKSMIDLGIGTGLELEAVFQRFPDIEVTGLDIAGDMLKLLVEKYPDKKINLHCESYFDYDFGNCLCDVALSVMTLHHYNHQTKMDLYRRIHNSLKNNGVYIECDYMLSEHEYENPQAMEDFYFSEFERLKKEQGITDNREYHYDTPCSVANQKKMLREAGFSSVKEVWQKKNTVIIVANK